MDIISQKIVKTNKDHKCWGCMRLFPKGILMQSVVSVDDEISRIYWCDNCQNKLKSLDAIDCQDGFVFGELVTEDYYIEKLAGGIK